MPRSALLAVLVLAACRQAATPPVTTSVHDGHEPGLPAGPGPDQGTMIGTTIKDATSGAGIGDALVMVLKPGVTATSLDMSRLDEQVLAWGRSNAAGEVHLKQRVPAGTYSLLVTAPGYEPLVGTDELQLAAGAPEYFDPWGEIRLSPR